MEETKTNQKLKQDEALTHRKNESYSQSKCNHSSWGDQQEHLQVVNRQVTVDLSNDSN